MLTITRDRLRDAADNALNMAEVRVGFDMPDELRGQLMDVAEDATFISLSWSVTTPESGMCGCLVGQARMRADLDPVPVMYEPSYSLLEGSLRFESAVGNTFLRALINVMVEDGNDEDVVRLASVVKVIG